MTHYILVIIIIMAITELEPQTHQNYMYTGRIINQSLDVTSRMYTISHRSILFGAYTRTAQKMYRSHVNVCPGLDSHSWDINC